MEKEGHGSKKKGGEKKRRGKAEQWGMLAKRKREREDKIT